MGAADDRNAEHDDGRDVKPAPGGAEPGAAAADPRSPYAAPAGTAPSGPPAPQGADAHPGSAPPPPPSTFPPPAGSPYPDTSFHLAPPRGAPFLPPPPVHPPTVGAPADPVRAVAVALLNLSGLGLGYALLRCWVQAAVCWAATAVLLLVALPADVDGVPRGALVGYLVLLLLAAADGARRALRTPLAWPPKAPLAVALGLALLLVPAGGTVAYDGARDEAVEQMLLDRLADTDKLVSAQQGKDFATAEAGFKRALGRYDSLAADHPGSRAADLVPQRLQKFYATVAAPYDDKNYCGAVAPLTYLRSVPDTVGKDRLGNLTTWPDDRLATSLLECGTSSLGTADGGQLGELLATFPDSPQAAEVEPTITSAIDTRKKALSGAEPCTATDQLRAIGKTAADLPGSASRALSERADSAVESGTYACGVDQFEDGDFASARETLTDFADTYKNDKNRARAQQIAIAAEIAEDRPAAGTRLPSTSTPGGSRMDLAIRNDSPDAVEVLYTGPVTGRLSLSKCASCTSYSSETTGRSLACKAGKPYPKKTLHLPAGQYHFLYKPIDSTGLGTARIHSDGIKIQPGYVYTDCTYSVSGLGLDL